MRLYDYDQVTGEFVGTLNAQPSPLEPGKFLIAAHSTPIAPPIAGFHEVARWTGQAWELALDLRGVEYWTAVGVRYIIQQINELPPVDSLFAAPESPPLPVLSPVDQTRVDVAQATALLDPLLTSAEYYAARDVIVAEGKKKLAALIK